MLFTRARQEKKKADRIYPKGEEGRTTAAPARHHHHHPRHPSLALPLLHITPSHPRSVAEEEVVVLLLLLLVLERVELVDPRPEVGRIPTEGDLERGEELVHSGDEGLGRSSRGLDGGLSLVDDDTVGKVYRPETGQLRTRHQSREKETHRLT